MASKALARRFGAPKIRYRTRVVAAARRGVSTAARRAREEKHTLAAVGAGVGFGLAKRFGVLDNLPSIPGIGPAATYGLVAWGIGRYTHSRTMQHLATGLLSIGAFQLASGGGVSGEDFDADVSGELEDLAE